MTIYIAFPNFEPVHCSMFSSNCCFLTRIHISQETGKMVWYSHFFKNLPQFVLIHTVKGLSIVSEAEVNVFLEFPCFLWSSWCWQLDLWFLCHFRTQLVHLEVLSSHTAEAWLERFGASLCSNALCTMWNECNLYSSLNILWRYPSLGLEWELTFSSPVATVEFSEFVDILSTTLLMHS